MIHAESTTSQTGSRSLKDELNEALPAGFRCKTRYVQSPPKQCEPLFSVMPGQPAEKTRLASHFLTVSVDVASLPKITGDSVGGDVISFAIEALAYTTKNLTTIFVSKVDSTSYITRIKPSPIKTIVTTFLQWLAQKERRKRPGRKIVISLFARAQAQYLFPGSSDDKGKHVLDDRQLIKWWARVLDPIIPRTSNDIGLDADYAGYLTVPGYANPELRSFLPHNATAGTSPRWTPGNPLSELAKTRGLPEHAPPRCLLPRYPDDPKARFITELDDEMGMSQDTDSTISPSKGKNGRWKSVMDLDRFWEAMEFRQECSSGRVVGFMWLVISPKKQGGCSSEAAEVSVAKFDSQELQISQIPSGSETIDEDVTRGSPKKPRKQKLTGPIVPRVPQVKTTGSNLSGTLGQLDTSSGDGITITKEAYDRAMAFLLNLDFSNLQIAVKSTAKWVSELRGKVGLNDDFAIEVVGSAKADLSATAATSAAVNDMSGMIRKKRKAGDDAPQAAPVENEKPAVNVLGGGMIRKKPKPATA